MLSLGIVATDSEEDSAEEEPSLEEETSLQVPCIRQKHLEILRSCDFNWFQFMDTEEQGVFLSAQPPSMLEEI